MTISAISSNEQTELETNGYKEEKNSTWNGRMITVNYQEPRIILCSNIIGDSIRDYFDSDKRRQNEFDIKIYQHHVRCNSEESKQHLERAFEKMATGVVGMVIGVICLIGAPFTFAGGGTKIYSIYSCHERLWMGIEEFKKAIETRNVSINNITFVTNAEDLKRNTEELVNHGIIAPAAPFQISGYQYTDSSNLINPLDTNNYHQPRNFNYNNQGPGYTGKGKKETQDLNWPYDA